MIGTKRNILGISLFGIFLAISITSLQQVNATGCPTNFVEEHIQNAKKALEEGNTEEVKNQLELAEQAISMAQEEGE
ncbi:MAG: hypothetical protein MRJ93_04390 [Nitrososphaeraceae archaeon]|nr:hypothetical protein [Nitrososphaeraceae archaeon]